MGRINIVKKKKSKKEKNLFAALLGGYYCGCVVAGRRKVVVAGLDVAPVFQADHLDIRWQADRLWLLLRDCEALRVLVEFAEESRVSVTRRAAESVRDWASMDNEQAAETAVAERRAGAGLMGDTLTLAAIVAVVVALGWRLADLDGRSLWFDESFSWQLTRFPWVEMIRRSQADVHPPFYYVLLKPWTAVLGDSAFVMRAYSVAWFGIALIACFLLCRDAECDAPAGVAEDARVRGRDSGLIAMLLLCASPFLFRYSQEARMYTQMIALAVLSSWLLLRALSARHAALLWWGGYGLAAAGLGYTHYFGLLSVAAQAVFVTGLLVIAVRERSRARWCRQTVCGAFAASVLMAVLYLPWLPTLRRQQEQVSQDYWAPDVNTSSPLSFEFWRSLALDSLMHNNGSHSNPFPDQQTLALVLSYGVLAIAGVVLVGLAWRRDRAGWCVIAGVLVPVIVSIVKCYAANRNLINSRYLMAPYVLLLVGLALALGRVPRRGARWSLAAAICVNLALLICYYQQSLGLPLRSESRGAADYIARHVEPGDAVVCVNPLDLFPMKYHARGRFAVLQARYPSLVVKHYTGGPIIQASDFLDWEAIVRGEVKRAWVVRRSSQTSGPELPKDWERIDHESFDEPLRFRGAVLLELWQRRPPARTAGCVPAHNVREAPSIHNISTSSGRGSTPVRR